MEPATSAIHMAQPSPSLISPRLSHDDAVMNKGWRRTPPARLIARAAINGSCQDDPSLSRGDHENGGGLVRWDWS